MATLRPPLDELPPAVCCVVEVPLGSRVKRAARGSIEYLSPWPCPFNYGSAVGLVGADGDAVDTILLGPRLERGAMAELRLLGRVRFLDGGLQDDKWICGDAAPTAEQLALLTGFFRRYSLIKSMLGRLGGAPGKTLFDGIELRDLP